MNADIRIALRQLRKSPGFAITAILTLALAIGANAIVFSVLNALVLRPLNVPHAENLYMLQRAWSHDSSPSQSYVDYLDLRDRNRSFESLVADDISGPVGLDTGSGNPAVAWPYLVSGNYFDSLGIQPYLGRFIQASDEHGKNSVPYVVLSYALWHSRFNGDPKWVGRTVELNKHPFTVLGVAPPDFRGTELFFAADLWAPIVDLPQIQGWDGLEQRGDHFTWVVGHLKPGVTPEAATADLNTIAAAMAKANPKEDEGLKFNLAHPGLVGDTLGRPARAFMAGLMLLAGLILLAACANLGSLFAARAADRSREIAVRMALGSRRKLILRQLFVEALLVSVAGGIVGMGGAVFILRVLSTWRPVAGIPINVPVNPDVSTYALALGLAIFSGILFALVPVRQVLRADPWQIIRSGSAMGNLRRFSLRDILLTVQIAICAVLVTSSLVAVRGLARSLHSDFGFQPQNVMLVKSDLNMAGYAGDQRAQMQRKMTEAAAAIPGVTAVGFADRLPLSIGGNDSSVFPDSVTDYRPANSVADAQQFDVSQDYFKAAGTTLLAGRPFTLNDNDKTPVVAVVNREFARKVLKAAPDKAIGAHYKVWSGKRVEVVGVVEDGKYETLTEETEPAMFYSYLQQPASNTWLLVRSTREEQEIAGALQRAMRGLDAGLPFEIKTWNTELDSALFAARVATVALGVLGLLGAMLAITGIFGMASYAVTKRLRELGIRVALGANQRKVLGAALGRAVRVLAIGSVAGMILGMLATRVLASIVYQATPRDPIVLLGVVISMMGVGLVAAWIPARQALAVDPMILLRQE
ncbi:MAG TPA: ABC transporter permease [Terracidiphilus sp.]|jgi:predicted permease